MSGLRRNSMKDLLEDIEIGIENFDIADKSTRFANHLGDSILFLAIFIAYVFIMEEIFGEISEAGDWKRPVGALILILSYFIGFEFFFSKTPAKFLTNTKVVDKNGNKPTLIRIVLRNIFRLIPFDNVSFLIDKRGFHDQFSGTYVIKVA